ncbi:TPA: hypothetical protein ACH3X1_014854 [Trebouxia sp. C0004]
MMNVVEGFTMNVIWPFLPFMVEAFGVASEDTVGLYVGILGASYYLAATCSAIVWGILADKVGRRPTLLAGTLGTCAANLVFGFAPSYKAAVFGRVLSGLLNSNAGISKTYLGESCTKEQQPAAFATFCVMYGLGSVIAPAIGGFLSQPADKYPDMFSQAGLFGRFPFALPTIIAAFLSLVAFCAGFFFLPETQAYSRRKQAESGHVSESQGLVSRSASLNAFDSEHPRRSVFGSFSSHKKETGVFRAHMIVSPLVAWHEVHDMWHELKDIVVHTLSRSTSYARLPELKHTDDSSSSQHHMQPLHPQASEAQFPQQVQGQQLAEKLQHKLQGDSAGSRSVVTATAETETALAADSQLQMDAQSHRRHHKMAHAHFAVDVDDDSIIGRNESITAVRGGEASSSQAEGSFWKRLDANGSFTSDPGAGDAASVKDAVRAALGQKAIAIMSPSGNALALAEEQRVRFWSRPALESPSLQQRVWHAWGAVQSPTGRAVLTYLIMGGIGTLYDELLPIFCSEDLEHGGLGMTSGQIGQILMVCGCALMLFQMFGYSRLSKALGPLRLLRLACWGHVIMMLLPAFGTTVVDLTSSGSWALWMYMTLAQVYKAIITGMCFTSVFICISNSAPNAKKVSLHHVTPGGHRFVLLQLGCMQLFLNVATNELMRLGWTASGPLSQAGMVACLDLACQAFCAGSGLA